MTKEEFKTLNQMSKALETEVERDKEYNFDRTIWREAYKDEIREKEAKIYAFEDSCNRSICRDD